jgi:hypothetical protein
MHLILFQTKWWGRRWAETQALFQTKWWGRRWAETQALFQSFENVLP